jgi:hypothetical protein
LKYNNNRFSSHIGAPHDVGQGTGTFGGSQTFLEVYADYVLKFRSDTINKYKSVRALDIYMTGADTLKLVVKNPYPSNIYSGGAAT